MSILTAGIDALDDSLKQHLLVLKMIDFTVGFRDYVPFRDYRSRCFANKLQQQPTL